MPYLKSEERLKQQVEVVQNQNQTQNHHHHGQHHNRHHHHHPQSPVISPARELAVFRAFNKHARSCDRCRKPLEVARRGGMLCEVGHHIAYEVAQVLYEIAGQKAEQYRVTTGCTGILTDLTQFDGAVYELVQAMDYGTRRLMPHPEMPVYASETVRKPVSRHSAPSASPELHHRPSSQQQHRSSHHHHHQHHYNHQYPSTSYTHLHEPAPSSAGSPVASTPSHGTLPHSSPLFRHSSPQVAAPHRAPPKLHHHTEPEQRPRASGTIHLNIPLPTAAASDSTQQVLQYGKEAGYYEEVWHPNGGRVTTKYYYPEQKTAAPAPLPRTSSFREKSQNPRKSTVHFAAEPEVREYYT